jgi:hypothetical protein
MSFNPNEIAERMRLAGEDWSDKDAAASLLEEARKSVLAELMNQAQGQSMAAKESEALASPEYREHVESMVIARKEANRAKVKYDTARAWIELVRTAEASKRQEMKG